MSFLRGQTIAIQKTTFLLWILITFLLVALSFRNLSTLQPLHHLQDQDASNNYSKLFSILESLLKSRVPGADTLVPPLTIKSDSELSMSTLVSDPEITSQSELLTKEDVAGGKLIIAQDDPRLLTYILKEHLKPPPTQGSIDMTPLDPKVRKYEQQEVYRFILELLGNKVGGFFIECGANDGEFYSNTLPLEVNQNWTGLLIEADPRPFKRLQSRNRKAWLADVCLSTTGIPRKIEMLRNDKGEGLSFIPGLRKFIGSEKDYYKFEAQCFPLFSILKAVNVTAIDYFSLDIEGAELGVLKTIPWDSVFIKALSIEVHPDQVQPVKEFMTSIGYTYVKFIKNGYSHDQIYVHKNARVV